MAFFLKNLGCNSGYLSPKALKDLGYAFIETSLGKQLSYPRMVQKILADLDEAKLIKMDYAIHLPVHLTDDWLEKYDCYDAFYLDPAEDKRNMAFEMLEDNLEKMSKDYLPMYYVIHFPGIYSIETCYPDDFETILTQALHRLSTLAERYNCKIALEYFATNARFSDYRHWIRALESFPRLYPLLDTGHLYFNCYKNKENFDEVMKGLAPHCIGFHLWNIFGEGYYDQSSAYQKYHHIIPHKGQTRALGWAFDPEITIPYLYGFDKPLLIEAGQRFNGESYFLEGLIQIREMLRKSE